MLKAPGTPWAFNVSVPASLLLIASGLHLWGAAEVRANPGEILFLTFLGAVWLVIATKGAIRDHGWAAIECKAAFGSGIYGCDPVQVLRVLRRACRPGI